MFVSQGPTPAVRPSEWTLSSVGEPCLSAASWLALRVWRPSHVMRPNGASMVLATFASTTTVAPFGTHQGASSAAGPNPGNTEKHGDTGVRYQTSDAFTEQRFSTGKSQDTFR